MYEKSNIPKVEPVEMVSNPMTSLNPHSQILAQQQQQHNGSGSPSPTLMSMPQQTNLSSGQVKTYALAFIFLFRKFMLKVDAESLFYVRVYKNYVYFSRINNVTSIF